MLERAGNEEKLQEYLAQHQLESDTDERPAVLSTNWNVVKVFLLLSNDWTRIGMVGAFQGISSQEIATTLNLSGLTLTPDEFEGLKRMEAEAKPLLNEALKNKD